MTTTTTHTSIEKMASSLMHKQTTIRLRTVRPRSSPSQTRVTMLTCIGGFDKRSSRAEHYAEQICTRERERERPHDDGCLHLICQWKGTPSTMINPSRVLKQCSLEAEGEGGPLSEVLCLLRVARNDARVDCFQPLRKRSAVCSTRHDVPSLNMKCKK